VNCVSQQPSSSSTGSSITIHHGKRDRTDDKRRNGEAWRELKATFVDIATDTATPITNICMKCTVTFNVQILFAVLNVLVLEVFLFTPAKLVLGKLTRISCIFLMYGHKQKKV